MPSVSVIIIAKNVAHEIVPALKTSQFADEVIVVDNGSTDDTLKVSRPLSTKIVTSTPEQNFSTWRNDGASAATSDWLLYLDSDERLTPALINEIKTVIQNPKFSAYSIPRRDIMLGRHLKHWPDSRVMRLIKKADLVRWEGKVHEQPKINGTTGELKNTMIHLTHKNIDEKVLNTLNWSRLESKMLFDSKHPPMKPWRFWRMFITEIFNRAIKQGLWKDGSEGTIEIIYQTFSRFITYVRLWELQHTPSLKETYQNIDQKILKDFKDK